MGLAARSHAELKRALDEIELSLRGFGYERRSEKILGDIKSDPKWFLGILRKRTKRIIEDTTPVGIALFDSSYYVKGPALGWLWLPVLAFTLLSRRWQLNRP